MSTLLRFSEVPMRISFLVVLLLPIVCRAADDLSVLPTKGDVAPRKMLHAYLIAETQKHFNAREDAIAALKKPEDVKKRQDQLRTKFIEAIGGFPVKKPLNGQVVGTLKRDGYRIEKVIFESRPAHHVTANLYLPDGKGPFPCVLIPQGHSDNGKASEATQRAAIALARHGIAAFPFDPISQGERKQLLDEKGKPFISSMTNEHTMIGVGAILVGQSTASYRIWDGIRAIDYVTSRSEIDPLRIGCTGCSGGGTMTSYLMALDERILAAAPSCYITSLKRLFATIGPQDAEQNIIGQVALGIDHADYLLMRAPKPTLICAATEDFFDIQGTWTTFREAKRIYTLLGQPERVDLVETNTKHGYPKAHREAMLRWMARWLLNKDEPFIEMPATIEKTADLLCMRTGQVLEEFKDRSCFDFNADRARELATARAMRDRKPDELRKQVAATIGVASVSPASLKKIGTIERNDYRIAKLLFETERGIAVPGLLFEKGEKSDGPLIIYLHGLGKEADAAPGGPIEKLVLAGHRVLAIDPRGMGETAPGTPSGKPSYFGNDFKESFLALHLNRPLLGQRVADVLAVIERMAKDEKTFQIVGIGAAAPIALHAAAFDSRIVQTTIEKGIISWENVAATPVSYNFLTQVVPSALAVYDLPDLAALIAPRGLTIREAVGAAGKPVEKSVLSKIYTGANAAYVKLKQEKKFVLE